MKNYLSFENNYDYMGYAKKYMSSHYLSYNLNNFAKYSAFEKKTIFAKIKKTFISTTIFIFQVYIIIN